MVNLQWLPVSAGPAMRVSPAVAQHRGADAFDRPPACPSPGGAVHPTGNCTVSRQHPALKQALESSAWEKSCRNRSDEPASNARNRRSWRTDHLRMRG